MVERVYLHVGTPKSGTTYLQSVLWNNVDALKDQGLLLPGNFQLHYTAAKGVTARKGLVHRTRNRMDRAWSRLVQEMRDWSGSALISHELMAPATKEQADLAKAALGDAEIHLVLTVRALHKQLPAAWQEQVKGGLGLPYVRYLEQVRDGTRRGAWFWEVQDVLAIADRWGDGIAPARVHVVSCPTSAEDPSLLWRRYASVFGVEQGEYDLEVPTMNTSLGVVETELLRRVHATGDYRFKDAERHLWTRRLLAGSLLAKRDGEPIRLPEDVRGWIGERTATMAAGITERGYEVVGDLGELVWAPPSPASRLVSSVTDAELAAVSAWVIGRLQEALVDRQPDAPYPSVGPDDGIPGIIELLEHIRAADTGTMPRPAAAEERSGVGLRALAARLRH